MRVPPYYRRPGWQRFFAGFAIGLLCGWTFFLYQYGTTYEKLVSDLKKQQITINDQQEQIEMLRSEEKKINEENQKLLTIQEISITFTNKEKSRLSELSLYELQQKAEKEVRFLKDKDIASIADNRELMIRTLENKQFIIGDHTYKLDVQEVYLHTTVELYVAILPGDDTN